VLRLLHALGIELEANMAPAPTPRQANDDTGVFDPDNPGPSS
jgi:hypothetical protein